jgi:hypothetical protein
MALYAQARQLVRFGRIELAALASQCLGRRIADRQKPKAEIAASEVDRNKHHTKADWQFAIDDARIKPQAFIPTF